MRAIPEQILGVFRHQVPTDNRSSLMETVEQKNAGGAYTDRIREIDSAVNRFSSTRLSKLPGRHMETCRSAKEADLYSHFILEIHSGP
jgi:hypothetical protein